MQVSPYLIFNGDCEEALKFYEQALGAKIEGLFKFAGSPAAEHVPPDWAEKILHATIKIDGNVVMASDGPPGHYEKPQGISVSISVNNRDKGEEIFNALSQGGTVTMPFQKTFWASGFGMCTDRFGIPWMVNSQD